MHIPQPCTLKLAYIPQLFAENIQYQYTNSTAIYSPSYWQNISNTNIYNTGAQFTGAQFAGAQFAAKGPNLPGPDLP